MATITPIFAEITSIVAICISLASLSLSLYNVFRDRAKLKITSKFYSASEHGPNRIIVRMVNDGRRPIILRLIGGNDSHGHWGGSYLEHEKGGLRLGEHEHYEYKFEKEDTVLFIPEGNDVFFDKLWVEDSLGRRHPIPESKVFIDRLWGKSLDTT
jgi:hypothetical protein